MIFVSILKSRDRAAECSITYKRRFKKILYAQTCPSKYDKRTSFYLNSFYTVQLVVVDDEFQPLDHFRGSR